MKTIDNLPMAERVHFIQCSLCDEWYDMRDREQVMIHQHANAPEAERDNTVTALINQSLPKIPPPRPQV